jgi:hypothetical protein
MNLLICEIAQNKPENNIQKIKKYKIHESIDL